MSKLKQKYNTIFYKQFRSWKTSCEVYNISNPGAGEVAVQFKALATFPEDTGTVPDAHKAAAHDHLKPCGKNAGNCNYYYTR